MSPCYCWYAVKYNLQVIEQVNKSLHRYNLKKLVIIISQWSRYCKQKSSTERFQLVFTYCTCQLPVGNLSLSSCWPPAGKWRELTTMVVSLQQWFLSQGPPTPPNIIKHRWCFFLSETIFGPAVQTNLQVPVACNFNLEMSN